MPNPETFEPARTTLPARPVEVAAPPDAPAPLVPPERMSEPARWPIRPGLTQLNHGSYGSCPAVVGDAQAEVRRRLELDPVRFFKNDLEHYADAARRALGAFVGAPAEDLALVPNGTFAIATALHGAGLEAGDEVVITNHEYAATINELDRLCARVGCRKVVAEVPFPNVCEDDVAHAVLGAITERTKLVIVSHIASASALVFPVERIVPAVRALGIDIVVDGAHTPGQLPLNIAELNPTYYAASCHKWLCTPKGTGFLYAEPEAQRRIKPLALSCRVHERRADRKAFLCDFDYVGTGDYSANLVIPVAIEHLGAQMPGGWDTLYQRNHRLARAGARAVCDRLGIDQPVPDGMTGTMVGVVLPADGYTPGDLFDDALWDRVYTNHGIQVPIWAMPDIAKRVMRLSAQLYNTLDDYERLGEALAVELARERG